MRRHLPASPAQRAQGRRRIAGKDPRKVAQQERSRATLDAIFDAMSSVIEGAGIDAFSVAEVARIANVGKASIYDYYPTRTALVSAWEERTIAKEMERVSARVAEIIQAPPKFELSAIELTTMIVDAFARHATKYRYRERYDLRAKSVVPDSPGEAAVLMFKAALVFAPSRARFRGTDLEVAARIITHSVLGLSYAFAVTSLSDDDRRKHARELARMVCRYLLVDCEDALFD